MNFGQPLGFPFSLSEFVMVNWDSLLDGEGGGENIPMSKPSILALPNGLMDSSPVPSPKSFHRLSAYSIAAASLSNV